MYTHIQYGDCHHYVYFFEPTGVYPGGGIEMVTVFPNGNYHLLVEFHPVIINAVKIYPHQKPIEAAVYDLNRTACINYQQEHGIINAQQELIHSLQKENSRLHTFIQGL